MDIKKALALKKGSIVHCPEDRGEKAYYGKVLNDCNNATIHETLNGKKFIWIEIEGPNHKTVWPSNRLG